MRNKLNSVFLIIVCFLLVGCANDFIINSYQSLSVSKEAYESTMTLAGDLYKQKVISEETKDRLIEIGRIYKFIHNEAVSALIQYQNSRNEQDKQVYLNAAQDVSKRLSELLTILKPYLLKEAPQ